MKNSSYQLLIYGSTGSIGCQALDLVARFPEKFSVKGLAAGSNLELLLDQIKTFRPEVAIIARPPSLAALKAAHEELKKSGVKTELLVGEDGASEKLLAQVAKELEYDCLLAGMTGVAGLRAHIEAIKRGKRLALANKESLVMAGSILTTLAREHNAEIFPVDSEHSALWQCLKGSHEKELRRVILTASGGPFRTFKKQELERVTVEQALRHPTWNMGQKISIDSATLFNKALEIIEAHWFFDLEADKLAAVVHPQSIVHSMVEFKDGSFLAHLGPTDMRLPIGLALSWPERLEMSFGEELFVDPLTLNFEAVQDDLFPSLQLGFEVIRRGGSSGAVFNAANEVAVYAFLAKKIPFLNIFEVVSRVLEHYQPKENPSLEDIFEADDWARSKAEEYCTLV